MRRALPLLLLMLVAACGSNEPPRVTFSVGATTAQARPAQYCDVKLTDCKGDDTAPVTLAVPAGTAVRVEVPQEVAETPWQIVYAYRDSAGARVDERSPVLASVADHTLELPAGAQLLTAEVQQYGPPPQANAETGEIEFPIRAAWILNAAA